jgi:NADP-dependent 3-hydroxy acid dehydrogenase YdfG
LIAVQAGGDIMSNNIEDKVVVITGASSGLGEVTARLLSTDGATVVLGARRQDRIEALASALKRAGGKTLAVSTDVTDRAQLQKLVWPRRRHDQQCRVDATGAA